MKPLTERYQADLLGVLSCYDRMIITGTLPGACYAGGMTSFLNFRHIKIFDYAKVFADPWRERIRQCAHELAEAHGIPLSSVTVLATGYCFNPRPRRGAGATFYLPYLSP